MAESLQKRSTSRTQNSSTHLMVMDMDVVLVFPDVHNHLLVMIQLSFFSVNYNLYVPVVLI